MAKCLRCGAGNEWIQGRVKQEQLDLQAELDEAKAAVFMPGSYPGSLADFLKVEVWPMPRTEDIEKIQTLAAALSALVDHYPQRKQMMPHIQKAKKLLGR